MLRWVKDIVAFNVADEYEIPEARYQRMAKESEFAMRMLRKLGALRSIQACGRG